ncbi:MAG: glycosyltransferase family 4 protein [Vicinamibacteria bacterium]|nr:glycosyltransferase family 4 protein [Vicinamibacteria bacterium]
MTMNIGLDLRPALSKPTGVGSYALFLARQLPIVATDMSFVFFSASLRQRFPVMSWPPNARLVDRRIPVRVLNYAWNRIGWPPLDRLIGGGLDLVHSPHPLIVPGKRARHVVTLHDLFFYKHPEMTRAEIHRDYVPFVRRHVQRADGVICVSEHTASEARLLLDIPPEKIAVIPNGIDPVFRSPITEEDAERVLRRRRLPRGAILFVGTEEKRKNLVTLAMAYLGLARRRPNVPPLVLVGPGSYWAQPGPPQIRATGYLETSEIRALMSVSTMLVLPSLEEGFGLPVAEAMAAGLPVVCSRGSALEEVAGDAATLVNPLDTESIASGIERLLDDHRHTAELREKGLARSMQFDWNIAARKTAEFYRKVLAR